MKYNSKVNDVYCSNDNTVVYKKYNEIAKDFNIKLPLTRSIVERNVINYLNKQTLSDILHVPKIINYNNNPPILIMENCNATPLSDLEIELFPSVEIWRDFFENIYNLKKISYKLSKLIFENQVENQNKIRDIMYSLKIENYQSLNLGKPDTFCLGDLSTKNILINKNKIFIIDFECSHWGYEGYDIGQFFAMLFLHCKKNSNISYYKSIINYFKNIIIDKKYVKKCFFWEKVLLPYYIKRELK